MLVGFSSREEGMGVVRKLIGEDVYDLLETGAEKKGRLWQSWE